MNKRFFVVVTETLPLVSFFLFYKLYGITAATASIVVTTIISVGVNYWQTKNVSKVSVISAVVITAFGLITILTKDTVFIKIKPTVVNIIFSFILLFGLLKKQSYLKPVLGRSINMKEEAWLELTKRFVLFFIFMAFLNEIMWRLFTESAWVNFKVFGILGCSICFILTQAPFISRNSINK